MADMLGSAIGAFGSSQIKPTWYSKPVEKNLDWLTGRFRGDDATLQGFLNNFTRSSADTLAKLKAAGAQAGTDYNNLFQQNSGYNPLDTYSTLRRDNLAALKDWSGQLEGAGSRGDNLAMAALGMGGRPDSSYASVLRSDRVSRNLAPVLGNIMSSLGRDTESVGNQRALNLGNLVSLINSRTNAPMIGYGMEMDPANALMALRSGETGLLGQQAGVAKDNTAGFYMKPDTLTQVGNSLNGFNDALWQNVGNAMSVYSSLYGGGMGGGGGIKTGNPGGGGYAQTSGPVGGFGGGAGGGGGGGSGINLSQIMSLFGGNKGSAPAAQSYNPWGNYTAPQSSTPFTDYYNSTGGLWGGN